jgi:hypothetical protein
LEKLPINVGRKNAKPLTETNEIKLSGIGIKPIHAIFKKDSNNNEIYLKPFDSDARDYIFINGKKLSSKEGVMLKHKDRIIFGTNSIFLFLKKFDAKENIDIDWEFAYYEMQKEIDEYNRKQNEENEKKKEEQLLLLRKTLEEKYYKEKNDIEKELLNKVHDYEIKLEEMNKTNQNFKNEDKENSNNVNKKILLERIEIEKKKKKIEYENREKNDFLRNANEDDNENSIKKKEQISKKLEHSMHNIVKKINKLRLIIDEIGRNMHFEVILSKNLFDYIENKNSSTTILIRVINYLMKKNNIKLKIKYILVFLFINFPIF